jgi:hypothetical protein
MMISKFVTEIVSGGGTPSYPSRLTGPWRPLRAEVASPGRPLQEAVCFYSARLRCALAFGRVELFIFNSLAAWINPVP